MSADFALVLRSKCATTVGARHRSPSPPQPPQQQQRQRQPAFDTAGRSAPPGSRQVGDDVVPSRPITCDVTIAPRRPVVDELSRDAARNPGVFLAPEQELLPCGVDNVLVLRDLPHHESEFSLTLSSCQVAGSNFSLQVYPRQSSFSFSLLVGADAGYVRELRGERLPTGEVTVEFDMSSAVRAQSDIQCGAEMEEKREQIFMNPLMSAERKEIIRGVVLSLERESRFVKTALSVMAGMGLVLMVAIAWTVANMRCIMRPRTSRSRTRSRRPSIPREVVRQDHGQEPQSSSRGVRDDERLRENDGLRVSSTCSTDEKCEAHADDGPDEKSEEPVETIPQSDERKVLQPALRSWYQEYLSPRLSPRDFKRTGARKRCQPTLLPQDLSEDVQTPLHKSAEAPKRSTFSPPQASFNAFEFTRQVEYSSSDDDEVNLTSDGGSPPHLDIHSPGPHIIGFSDASTPYESTDNDSSNLAGIDISAIDLPTSKNISVIERDTSSLSSNSATISSQESEQMSETSNQIESSLDRGVLLESTIDFERTEDGVHPFSLEVSSILEKDLTAVKLSFGSETNDEVQPSDEEAGVTMALPQTSNQGSVAQKLTPDTPQRPQTASSSKGGESESLFREYLEG